MIFRAKDEDDAIRIANDSPFGLGGSVFTQNAQHGAEVAKKVSTGMILSTTRPWSKPTYPLAACAVQGTDVN